MFEQQEHSFLCNARFDPIKSYFIANQIFTTYFFAFPLKLLEHAWLGTGSSEVTPTGRRPEIHSMIGMLK